MTSFTSDDRAFINSKPLPVNVYNCVAELDACEKDGVTTQEAISVLLATLQAHPVALRLRFTYRSFSGELALINSRLQSDDFDLSPFTPLTTLIASKGSNVDIWQAVLDLIDTFNGTSCIYSSASFRDSEQTRKILQEPIRQELAGQTYVDVQGFFTKYFENKSWSNTVNRICDQATKDGVLHGFPKVRPEEDDVWKWFDDFQKKHLTNARGLYYRTKSQQEIILKARTIPIGEQHDAREFRVIGELTKSTMKVWEEKYIQLATYVRDTFAAQPTRWFVHGFLVFGSQMQLWVFDRSGAYGAEVFDVHKYPQRFVRVIAGYAMMSDSELGMGSVIKSVGSDTFVTVTDAITNKDLDLRLESTPIVSGAAIVSRGTTCFRTYDGNKVVKLSWRSDKQHSEADLLAIARSIRGVPQLVGSRNITTIEELRSDLEIKIKRTLGHELPGRSTDSPLSSSTSQSMGGTKRTSVTPNEPLTKRCRSSQRANLRQGRLPNKESKDSKQDTPQADLPSPYISPYKNRVLTCLAVSPAGRPLQCFQSVLEVLQAFRDTIKAHRSLFLDRNILHRDISINNIILTDPAQNSGCSGMLIDLDLAVLVGKDGKNTTSEDMTGTLEFMAIQILGNAIGEETAGIERTYRHDLESFFYVFLWLCILYGRLENTREGEDALMQWYTGSFRDICTAKRGMMEPGGFEEIMLKYFSPTFQGHKDLARRWRKALFGEGALQVETPKKPEVLYGPIVKALEDAIRDVKW